MFLDKMRGQACGVDINFVAVPWMVEARHGMVFRSLWPREKWVHGHCSASTSNHSPCAVASYVLLRWLDWQRDTFVLSARPGVGHP